VAKYLDCRLERIFFLNPEVFMSLPPPSDVAAAPADSTQTSSGLAYKILQGGSGTEHPASNANVEVHYTGWMTNGQMFDSSVVRGEPASFPLDRVIKGWTEGLQLMKVGDKARFWIPGDLAYGNEQQSERPYGMLVFDVELLSFVNPAAPPAVPEDLAGAPADATTTASGLQYRCLQEGSGDSPSATANVNVHYSGWMVLNGEMFDSSVVRNEPISFGLNQVIPGWSEGLQLMKVGEKARLWIPGNLAYGETPSQPGYPYGTLVFDVELLSFEEPPAPPAVPEDLTNPPADATTTASGLKYRCLQEGSGASPGPTANVNVHYSGWMVQNGEMFDSSVVRGEPISFGLNQVIPGWTEGLQLMKVGEKARLWIPGNLAYGETASQPGYPYGTLVFDVELLSFT
jgi:peptidylprolyl isomerase